MTNLKENTGTAKIIKSDKKILLASPTMHGSEQRYVRDAFEKNWITTVGENVSEVERLCAEYAGVSHAVALSCGTAALHLAVKLAGERLYGVPKVGHGTLEGKKVFCSDMTFDATVNPVVYECGTPVFIDTEYDTWNMSPAALEKAFEMYPEARLVVLAHLYGTPAKVADIKDICQKHDALLIEDAAEALGAEYLAEKKKTNLYVMAGDKTAEIPRGGMDIWKQAGSFGDYGIISFNGNKIITGSGGGALLTQDEESADIARKWSTQSREAAPWYEHEEVGYNYRMSNIVAGIVRGQYEYLDEHIAEKKRIYERYRDGFEDLPVEMNPYDEKTSKPNYWLSCMSINTDSMCRQIRSDRDALYQSEHGKTCPTEILETLGEYNIEGRPIWKPMHMQPMYRLNDFVTADGYKRAADTGADIFDRGLCLPSDIKMTDAEQDRVIEIVRACFG